MLLRAEIKSLEYHPTSCKRSLLHACHWTMYVLCFLLLLPCLLHSAMLPHDNGPLTLWSHKQDKLFLLQDALDMVFYQSIRKAVIVM